MMRKALLKIAAGPMIALGTIAPAQMMPLRDGPVTTGSGAIAGTALSSGVRAYFGIPFAQPPVGTLRWAAPQPFRWEGVWNADRKGPECIQILRPHDINHYFGEEPSSENCLYLNLWAPAAAKVGAKLPVIVFIYGGGFTVGSSGMANYDGENVAKHGAIFVNFNYRVGALGFLAHPGLSAEQGGHSGNYGIMDQIAALKWIHANIDTFGGDPDKVLIIGQSAGAASVAANIFSPMAKGLFRAAVMSSGCNFDTAQPLGDRGSSLSDAEQTGLRFQQAIGAKDLDAMRQVPADRILAAQSETQLGAHVEGVRICGPIVDGYVIPAARGQMLADHNINAVPIIANYNGDDIDVGMSPFGKVRSAADYSRIARATFGADADAFLKLFPVPADADAVVAGRRVASMMGLEASARRCAIAQAGQGAPTYIDYFTRKHPYAPEARIADQDIAAIGAYHTADIPYWFDTLDRYNAMRTTRNWTDYDRMLSDKMLGALIAMASTGSPSTPAMPWPAWTKTAETKIVFGDEISLQKLDAKRLSWLQAHAPAPRPRMPSTSGVPRD